MTKFNPLKEGFKNHTVDWERGEFITLAEFERRMKARPKKRSKRNGSKA